MLHDLDFRYFWCIDLVRLLFVNSLIELFKSSENSGIGRKNYHKNSLIIKKNEISGYRIFIDLH